VKSGSEIENKDVYSVCMVSDIAREQMRFPHQQCQFSTGI